ncbi:MAG: amidohydrolase, partial [Gammaproteobacteria bacterium]|nr:amidohydrolase [Gammaproteobacteria bacterium]
GAISHRCTVDADGHLLEPAWLWEKYLEKKYVDRALRIKTDDAGLEYLEIDGKPSLRTNKGTLGLMGAMGDADARPSPDRQYMATAPYGSMDAGERIDLLARENLDKTVLYPTLGLLWECELEDAELTLAYHRAYNRWVADFCRDSGGRLVPIAHLTLLDPAGSAIELERAVKDGCKGGFVCPYTHTRKPHGHVDHDVLWRKAAELGVPMAIHPTFEPQWATPIRFDGLGAEAGFFYNVMLRQGMQQALLSFFALGTLERMPTLKLGVLESGCGWVGAFLDRMDALFDTATRRVVPLRDKPSEYFRRQCFISGDPDETAAAHIIDHVGADLFMWATDYPHPDHPGTWAHALTEFVKPLSAPTRAKVLGENVTRIYRL